MGTRSTTLFLSEWNEKKICNMYRQYDGYLDGHGRELKEFLEGAVLVNGIGTGETRKTFNGMGCLAASVIAHFKKDIGGHYMCNVDQEEEYHYTVYAGEVIPGTREDRIINLKVTGYGDQEFYDGPLDDFDPDMKEDGDEHDEEEEELEEEEEEETIEIIDLSNRLKSLEEKVDKIIEAL